VGSVATQKMEKPGSAPEGRGSSQEAGEVLNDQYPTSIYPLLFGRKVTHLSNQAKTI
jgi:hypothetical protein